MPAHYRKRRLRMPDGLLVIAFGLGTAASLTPTSIAEMRQAEEAFMAKSLPQKEVFLKLLLAQPTSDSLPED